ncbi:MAG: GIY-YIG nuclease family protein [Candidatus Roizmanbacteria bacterium]
MDWYLYIVKCSDNSLYTGITTNITRRIYEHNTDNLKGSKSLRGKRPVKLVYKEIFKTQNEARKREVAIKNWKRKYKLQLIEKIKGFTL